MKRPKLGQICTVSKKVVTSTEWLGDEQRLERLKVAANNPAWKYPFRTFTSAVPIPPVQAIYTGFRVTHEGVTSLEYDDDGHGAMFSYPVFKHNASKTVWVFVKDERSSPFWVFPEDVEILPPEVFNAYINDDFHSSYTSLATAQKSMAEMANRTDLVWLHEADRACPDAWKPINLATAKVVVLREQCDQRWVP